MSYYERWVSRLDAGRALRPGDQREFESGKAAPGSTKSTPALSLATSARWLSRGIASSHDPNVRPLFKVGQRVRARNINPTGHTRLPRTRAAKSASSSEITVSISSPTPTPIFRARNASTSTPSVSRHGNCGANRHRRETRSISICGMTTLSEPSPALSSEHLSDPPRLPRDEGGPSSPNRGRRRLSRSRSGSQSKGISPGRSGLPALANELQAAARRGEPDDGSRYYEHWLAALESSGHREGLGRSRRARTRKEAWAAAYRNTPHGQPVELLESRLPQARWLLLGVVVRSRRTGYFGKRARSRQPNRLWLFRTWDSLRAPAWAHCSACGTRSSRTTSRRCQP